MIKSKLSVILIAAFSSIIFSSAIAGSTQDNSEMAPPKPLNNKVYDSMVGTWEGEGDMMGAKMRDTMKIKWDLNHQFLMMSLKSKGMDNSNEQYEGLGIYGVTKRGNAKVWWYDSWGADAMAIGTGKFSNNGITMIDGNKMFRETRTFTINGDKMTMVAKGVMTMNGKKMPYNQTVVYTKD